MVRRIDGQRRHPRDPHIGTILGDLGLELLPVRAAVGRAVKRRRPGPGKDRVRVCRIDRDAPDVELVHRRFEPLKALPAIGAFVDPVIGAGEEGARLFPMHAEGKDPALAPQPLADPPPALAAVRAEPRAAADRPDTDREIACHGFPP